MSEAIEVAPMPILGIGQIDLGKGLGIVTQSTLNTKKIAKRTLFALGSGRSNSF